jgi:hypothetical protein
MLARIRFTSSAAIDAAIVLRQERLAPAAMAPRLIAGRLVSARDRLVTIASDAR